MSKCLVDSCERSMVAKGYCSLHYYRLKRTGTLKPRYGFNIITNDPEARFWSKIKKRSDNECWKWIAKSKVDGYGYFSVGKDNKILAHRYSWQLANGEIPKGEGYHGSVIMHMCDNRLCVNPKHLILGTQKDNVLDMDKKGRRKTVCKLGSDHHMTTITEEQAAWIYKEKGGYRKIAETIGCTRAVVNMIKRNKTWNHITKHLTKGYHYEQQTKENAISSFKRFLF